MGFANKAFADPAAGPIVSAFKKAFRESGPVLLEPIMKVEVETPTDFQGSIAGDIASRRGYGRVAQVYRPGGFDLFPCRLIYGRDLTATGVPAAGGRLRGMPAPPVERPHSNEQP